MILDFIMSILFKKFINLLFHLHNFIVIITKFVKLKLIINLVNFEEIFDFIDLVSSKCIILLNFLK